MRPIWTGAVSFGLVNIPVKLFSAVQESSLDLDMLDKRDHSNIKFKRVNEATGKEVAYENIVKGYLYHDDYVVLEEEDFENADAKKTKTIEVLNFSNEDEVDSIYYEQPYYLQPDKSGEKAYAIMRDAMMASGKVGVCSFVLRNKEALAILKPYGQALVLNRIRFEEEIRDTSELALPAGGKGKTKETEMANKLIEQLTEKFSIAKYKDTYTAKLLDIIKQKAKGKKPRVKKLKIVHSKSKDIMELLKQSIEGAKRKAS